MLEKIVIFPSFLESLLASTKADHVTTFFLATITLFFLLSLFLYKKDRYRSFTHYTPNLLTSLGILGTFIGIVIGLLHFDTDNIDDNISQLLGGLQTAFMTSLFGMAMTIFYKLITSLPWLQPKTDVASGPDEIGPEHIHQLMREQNDNLAQLHQAIAGDDSDTLTGQIRMLRQNQDDNHKAMAREAARQAEAAEKLEQHAKAQQQRFDEFSTELSKQMQDFAEMMSKSATEQVINALKEVIQDFNNQLTEQFGENFKALDASVKSLVDWQENYRQQLEEMRDQYAQGVTAITQTESSVSAISEKADAIPEAMQGLETLLNTAQHQINELESHLAAFQEMRNRAVEAVPEIRSQVESTVNDVSQAAQSAAQQLSEGSTSLKDEMIQGSARINQEMIEGATGLNERYSRVHESLQSTSDHIAEQSEQITTTLKDAGEQTNQQLRQSQAQVQEMIDSLQKQHRQALESASEQYQRDLSSTYQKVEAAMQQAAEKTGESVNKQFTQLDSEMQQELTKALQQMGDQLAQITGRFTQDYKQLTDQMQQVVQSADREPFR
ncbi:hypothetical protein QWY74_05320 [Halomonas almeriensis]|uniref:hypothetical protein n=1 Tax=Halomonas almeriensis TaxID=308163 RepID=UPI0025B43DD2|nr:hypothetical protein [Halomonas almeriensis]MDN3552891.1 hypothetical protein [Halomonas almeriensis]